MAWPRRHLARARHLADVQVLALDLSAWLPVCATGELPCGRDGTVRSSRLVTACSSSVAGVSRRLKEDEDEDEDEHEDDEAGRRQGRCQEGKDDADEEPGHAEGGEDVVLRLTSDGSPTSTL